ncbi:general stress protein [Jiangella muralis]|uniref:general stress protein n=1 Tax=Jiangella muralis TaxID=702383 RepID=UPI00069E6EF3|nr:general stress protein [Jiangella muralis]
MTNPPEERLRARQGRRTIAAFETYAEAERAVDYLSDRRFPVERVAVVGHDLVMIEEVTGRLTYAGSALRGAASGAVIGALFGWVVGLFDWIDPLITGLLLAERQNRPSESRPH